MIGATEPSGLPSHEAVLEGLRRACFRQVVRYRHEPMVDALRQLGFVDWGRQPTRLSQLPASARSASYHAPVEVAQLTATAAPTDLDTHRLRGVACLGAACPAADHRAPVL
jgi:hypothetical protein